MVFVDVALTERVIHIRVIGLLIGLLHLVIPDTAAGHVIATVLPALNPGNRNATLLLRVKLRERDVRR